MSFTQGIFFNSFKNVGSIFSRSYKNIIPKERNYDKYHRRNRKVRRIVRKDDIVKAGSLLVIQSWRNLKYHAGYFVKHSSTGSLVAQVEGKVSYTNEPIETHRSLVHRNLHYAKDDVTFLHICPTPCPLKLKLIGFRTLDENGNIIMKELSK